jgi:hypothetical protein
MCSKSQPDADDDDDDDPIGSQRVAVWIIYKIVFDDYLFTPYLTSYVNAVVTEWGQV